MKKIIVAVPSGTEGVYGRTIQNDAGEPLGAIALVELSTLQAITDKRLEAMLNRFNPFDW